jgi:hypothetical protein
MKYCKCDQCGKEQPFNLQIGLKGYHPNKSGGILIPESSKTYDFCSHKCFDKWMRWALDGTK